MSIVSVPFEILQKIFSYCREKDQKAISQVCRRWNEAVEYLLMPRMCLKVSRVYLISMSVLLDSTRKYTRLEVELYNEESADMLKAFKGLMDVCRKRYQIEHLYFGGSPNKAMVDLFKRYHGWLQNLTTLDVSLEPAEPRARAGVGQMVTLPNLKRLRWDEGGQEFGDGQEAQRSNSGKIAFGINAPKLSFLSVEMDNNNLCRNVLTSCHQDPEVCHLFLPTLELKVGSDLRCLEITGLLDVEQCYIDGSQRILENLEQLVFNGCFFEVVLQICRKCRNLKELTIYPHEHNQNIPLQISRTLSANLEKLRISNPSRLQQSFVVYGPAVFKKLKYLYLHGAGVNPTLSLNAPQLTAVDIFESFFKVSNIIHTAQLRTMGLQMQIWDETELHPVPNVTELCLYDIHDYEKEHGLLENYLKCAPHLTRLKLSFGEVCSDPLVLIEIDLAFIETLPKLEHLIIHQAIIRLADCVKLAGLKSLLLSRCVIDSDDPDDEMPVVLTALEYVRVDRVTIDSFERSYSFPLQFNEGQPAIEVVAITIGGMVVFSSNNFEPILDIMEARL